MKPKEIPVKSKSPEHTSPHVFSWPEKRQHAATEQQGKQPKTNTGDLPDSLFHPIDRKTGHDISFPVWKGTGGSVKKVHIVVFIVLALAIVVPFQLQSARNAYAYEASYASELVTTAGKSLVSGITAVSSGDAEGGLRFFQDAKQQFTTARSYPRRQHPIVAGVIETLPLRPKQYDAFIHGTDAGFKVASAGVNVLESVVQIQQGVVPADHTALPNLEEAVHKATADIVAAHYLVSKIDTTSLPTGQREAVEEYKKLFEKAVAGALKVDAFAELIGTMLGYEDPATWMFVFQNSAELRATGGFMGSYGIAKLEDGALASMEVPGGGTYDLRGSFRKNVVAPEPLHLINPIWEFQDSNWWPDWPTTAEKIIWFYEQGDGATVDGVISFTPSFLERFLDITGPIELTGEYSLVLDKYNAYDTLQTFTEVTDADTDAPKRIIGEIVKSLFEDKQLSLNHEQAMKVLMLVISSIEERQLLVYWNHADGQAVLAENGLDGAVVNPSSGDYFMVVHTNIAGGKSDRSIRDVVNIDSEILSSGDIKNTVTVTRTHHGREGTGFSGVRNVDYIRFYVPHGATLLSASGFNRPDEALFESPPEGFSEDVDYLAIERRTGYDEASKTETFESFNKTVFANWLMVDPGESRTVTLEYVLPSKMNTMPELHTLYVQKQPGWQGAQLNYSLTWPAEWNPAFVNDSDPAGSRSVFYETPISKDIRLTTEWKQDTYAKR